MSTDVISVIGLGYVGLPLAAAFGKAHRTIGFDIAPAKVASLKQGKDPTGELDDAGLAGATKLSFTSAAPDIAEADVHIVCVPTPVDASKRPDFGLVIKACETVGKHMKQGAIVVFESTVYPGATEEICVPTLERVAGKRWKQDFFVGYSPERINPGDRTHTLTKIKKIVAGDTPQTTAVLAKLYGSIIEAGIYVAESIKVAEAAKIIENTQRDVNIALINECAMIFHKMDIDTLAVLRAAETKWNFLPFRPGLVGGHCIGVDPYYLTEKALMLGHNPQVILAGRSTNDGMAKYIAEQTVKLMIRANIAIKDAKVAVLGLTFKENVSDLRNSKVADVIDELRDYGITCLIYDPVADKREAHEEYGFELVEWDALSPCSAAILAVAHADLKARGFEAIAAKVVPGGCFVDVKGVFDQATVQRAGLHGWRL